MDCADLAAEREQQMRDDALASRPHNTGAGSRFCTRCGEEISPARRAALPRTTLCIDCATESERRR